VLDTQLGTNGLLRRRLFKREHACSPGDHDAISAAGYLRSTDYTEHQALVRRKTSTRAAAGIRRGWRSAKFVKGAI